MNLSIMKQWLRGQTGQLSSSWSVFCLFCFVFVLPIWLVDYPPMVDLPGHASQIKLMHNLHAEDFLYTGLFRRYYLTPYWGGYVPVYLLSCVFGVVSALKIIITLALVGIPFFTKKIINYFGGNPAWAWLCFPAAYSNAFYCGFLNYIFTVAVGLGWVYYCVKVADRTKVKYYSKWLICLGVVVLFFGHVIACGMLGLIVAIYYLFINQTLKQRVALFIPLLIFIPLAGGFFWLRMSSARGMPSELYLDYSLLRYIRSLSLIVGRYTWWSSIAGVLLLILPFWTGGALTKRLNRLLPLVVILLFVLFLPSQMMGTYRIYHRFYIFVVPILIFALEYKPANANTIRNLLPLIIALIVVSKNTSDIMKFALEHEDYNKVIEKAEPDSRIFKIITNAVSTEGDFLLPVYDHFPSWHHLRGRGLVDFNFASFGRMPVSYEMDELTKVPRYGFSWKQHHGECYDYFISRANADPFFTPNGGQWMHKEKVKLIVSSGMWFLHKNKNPVICDY